MCRDFVWDGTSGEVLIVSKADLAVMSKIRTRYGSFLTGEDYKRLLQCTGVRQVASLLSANPLFSGVLENMHEGIEHRGGLEALLKKAMYENLASLCRFDSAISDDLYSYIIRYIEINCVIGLCLRSGAEQTAAVRLTLPEYFREHIKLDFEPFLKSSTPRALLDATRELTIFPSIKRFYMSSGEDENLSVDFTGLEAALFSDFYDLLFKGAEKYDKETRSSLEKMLGTSADIHNLKTFWRCRKYYPESFTDIDSLIIHHGCHINKRNFHELMNSDERGMLMVLATTPYKSDTSDTSVRNRPFDSVLSGILYSRCKKALRFSQGTPAVLAAYVLLLKIQHEDLTTIIESVRYDIPVEQRHELIVSDVS